VKYRIFSAVCQNYVGNSRRCLSEDCNFLFLLFFSTHDGAKNLSSCILMCWRGPLQHVLAMMMLSPNSSYFDFLWTSCWTSCVWLGSLTVTCRTCNPEVTQRRRFDSAPVHCRVTTLGKLFTHICASVT